MYLKFLELDMNVITHGVVLNYCLQLWVSAYQMIEVMRDQKNVKIVQKMKC